jgi:hypothetical protein
MPDPAWLPWVGVVTGSIGAISGISGSVLGVKAYRRGARDKALDLRVQLLKDTRELLLECDGWPQRISGATRSRQNVAAAAGRTGFTVAFVASAQADAERVAVLRSQLVAAETLDDRQDIGDLERRLVDVHGIRTELGQLDSKYRGAMAEDDAMRDRLARGRGTRPM